MGFVFTRVRGHIKSLSDVFQYAAKRLAVGRLRCSSRLAIASIATPACSGAGDDDGDDGDDDVGGDGQDSCDGEDAIREMGCVYVCVCHDCAQKLPLSYLRY